MISINVHDFPHGLKNQAIANLVQFKRSNLFKVKSYRIKQAVKNNNFSIIIDTES